MKQLIIAILLIVPFSCGMRDYHNGKMDAEIRAMEWYNKALEDADRELDKGIALASSVADSDPCEARRILVEAYAAAFKRMVHSFDTELMQKYKAEARK